MAVTLKVPKLAVSMQTGVLQEWLVPDGATVAEGQPIYTIEAEKVSQDIEAPVGGRLVQLAKPGDTMKVGTKLGEILEQEDTAISAAAPSSAVPLVSLFGPVARIGYVVKDISVAVEHWALTLGAGPFFLFKDIRFSTPNYHGQLISPRVTLAFAASGDLTIQLIQQHDDIDSTFRDSGVGLHHLGVFAKQLDPVVNTFREAGGEVAFSGAYPLGGRFALLDAKSSLGYLIEVVEEHPALLGVMSRIRNAHRQWDRRTIVAG